MDEVGEIWITSEDISRGYKEIVAGTSVAVTTNDPNGYMVSVCCKANEKFDDLEVSLDNNTFRLSAYECRETVATSALFAREVKQLNYRVHITPELVQGRYTLPVNVIAYSM